MLQLDRPQETVRNVLYIALSLRNFVSLSTFRTLQARLDVSDLSKNRIFAFLP